MRGTTMPDLGMRNELVVLEAIRNAPEGSSQSEVMRRSGLSRQAVSLITRRLLERGLIETDGTRAGSRGKPRTVLRIVPRARLAAGVHLDPAQISVVVIDLLAEVVAERSLEPPSEDPASDVGRIAGALLSLQADLRRTGWRAADGRDVAEATLGIGVASPGGLDSRSGVVLNPPWLPGWRDVPLVEMLEAATSLPVELGKDTNAALTAENWSGAHAGSETVLYLYVGAGVGSAVTVGGALHDGASTQAGEIGHLPTGLDGARCRCGRRSCLSLFTDVATVLTTAQEQGALAPDTGASTRERLHGLTRLAQGGEAVAARLLAEYGAALGEALRTLIGVHDPHRVIIGGPFWDALAPVVLPVVQERAAATDRRPRPPHILSSTLGDDVAAVGAATLFLQRELSPTAR